MRRGRPLKGRKKAVQVTIYVPYDLLELTDEVTDNRSEWIVEAIIEKHKREGRLSDDYPIPSQPAQAQEAHN